MKKNNSKLGIIICAIIVMLSQTANAQKKWSFEIRPGVNFATKNLGNANLKTGFGFEGTINYLFMPHLAAYAGWGWNQFSADQSFAGPKNDFEETGYTFGLQFIHPIEKSKISYLIEVGGIANHIEVENENGDIIADSKHGIGWQAGAGVVVKASERFRIMPAIRYRSLSRDITIGSTKTPVDLNYLSFGVGFSFSF